MVWLGVISRWDQGLCAVVRLPWDFTVKLEHLQLTFLGGSCQNNLLLQIDFCSWKELRSCECGPAEGSWVMLELVLEGCRGNSGLLLQHGVDGRQVVGCRWVLGLFHTLQVRSEFS